MNETRPRPRHGKLARAVALTLVAAAVVQIVSLAVVKPKK